jgi:DNA-binding response OmpR family regulator
MEREVALTAVWGKSNYYTSRSMDVYITKLRKYLKDDPNVEIVNVHGEGYKLMLH